MKQTNILPGIMRYQPVWKLGLHFRASKPLANLHHRNGKWPLLSSLQPMSLAPHHDISNPFIGEWPLFANIAIFSAILVVLLTYFALPILSRVFSRWLYPGNV